MSETLDAFERSQLRRAERTIRKGLRTFVQVGEALLTIRDARLYRDTHATFEAYCADRWAISKTHGNRLIQAAAVMRELPAEDAPTSERQARELAPLLDRPGVMRRAWATVMHRTGGKPTAQAVRDVVHETIPHQTPAGSGASADAPGRAEAGAPADLLRGASAGAARPNEDATFVGERTDAPNESGTKPPATELAGVGGGPAAGPLAGAPGRRSASGALDAHPLAPSGAPTEPRPKPKPASPHAGPESGGTVAPSASSQVDGADGASPCSGPVGQGEAPVLTDAEIHEAVTDEWSPHHLTDLGCRLALAHQAEGAPLDRAVAAAIRQTSRPGRLAEQAQAVRS